MTKKQFIPILFTPLLAFTSCATSTPVNVIETKPIRSAATQTFRTPTINKTPRTSQPRINSHSPTHGIPGKQC